MLYFSLENVKGGSSAQIKMKRLEVETLNSSFFSQPTRTFSYSTPSTPIVRRKFIRMALGLNVPFDLKAYRIKYAKISAEFI